MPADGANSAVLPSPPPPLALSHSSALSVGAALLGTSGRSKQGLSFPLNSISSQVYLANLFV